MFFKLMVVGASGLLMDLAVSLVEVVQSQGHDLAQILLQPMVVQCVLEVAQKQ